MTLKIDFKMKRSIYSLLLIVCVVTACQQEQDEPLMGKPEQRMSTMLSDYRQQLVSSEHGWEGFLFPGVGGGYSFLFEFSDEGRVTMMSDINSDCATQAKESSF